MTHITRRNALAATAGVMAVAALPSVVNGDAELFRLLAEYQLASDRFSELGDTVIEAYWAAYKDCPPPAELVYGTTQSGHPMAPRSESDLEALGSRLPVTSARRKIVREYEARLKPVYAKHKIPEMEAECERLYQALQTYHKAIPETPANTLDGLCAKLRFNFGDDGYDQCMKGTYKAASIDEAVIASMVRDLDRMRGAA